VSSSWRDWPAGWRWFLAVPCETCGAEVGSQCVVLRSKRKGQPADPHEARVLAANRAALK
jgi:hypothetical protein